MNLVILSEDKVCEKCGELIPSMSKAYRGRHHSGFVKHHSTTPPRRYNTYYVCLKCYDKMAY